MNELKKTTMLWKRLNYSCREGKKNGAPGLNQLKSSLEHTLRTVTKRELEFDSSLSYRNLVVIGSKIVRLDTLSISQRQEIVEEIYGSFQQTSVAHEQLTSLKNERSKYIYKLKKITSNPEEPESVKRLITQMLDSLDVLDESEVLNVLSTMSLKRVGAKQSAVSKYIQLQNKILGSEDNSLRKGKTVAQESFFKFPSRNNIVEVKPEHYITIINGFHKKYLPEYEIKALVFHGDEVLSKAQNDGGVHPHIFISGRNSSTGKYDLVQAQTRLVNSYLAKKSLPLIIDGSYQSAQRMGEVYQQIIYEHVNVQLKRLGYNIEAHVSEKTEAHKAKLMKIKEDSNKAKIHRAYNLLTHSEQQISEAVELNRHLELQAETARGKAAAASKLRLRLVNKSGLLNIMTNKASMRLEELSSQIKEANELKESLKAESDVLKAQNNDLLRDIEVSRKALDSISAVEKAILLIAYTAKTQADIKRVLSEFTDKNYKALKSLNPSQRQQYIINIKERLAIEGIDVSERSIVSRSGALKLKVNDLAVSLIKLVPGRRSSNMRNEKPKI